MNNIFLKKKQKNSKLCTSCSPDFFFFQIIAEKSIYQTKLIVLPIIIILLYKLQVIKKYNLYKLVIIL